MRRFFYLTGMALFVLLLAKLATAATANFTIARITSNLPYHAEWEVKNPANIDHQLKQKYFFLGNGLYSWAFISEDGQQVVKFFKFRFTWYDLFKNVPFPQWLEPYKPRLTEKQIHRRAMHLQGYALAFNKTPDEAALKAAFLNGKKEGLTTLRIVDNIGIEHVVDLHNKPFVIQRTAVPLVTHITPMMQEGRIEEAREAVVSVIRLISDLASKGIIDDDKDAIWRNVGFIGKHAVYIDPGMFVEDLKALDPTYAEEKASKAAGRLIAQLDQNAKINVQ